MANTKELNAFEFESDFYCRAIYADPFVPLKFDWTIDDYDVDAHSGYESPPVRLYDKTVHFVLERHRNDDDGGFYDSLVMRSDFRMLVSGSVTLNDYAKITIPEKFTVNPGVSSCLVDQLSIVNTPKVKIVFDMEVNGLVKKEIFHTQKKRVTKTDADMCRSKFVKEMRRLWKNPQFSDVRVFTPDGQSIQAHKTILSARSPVFANMFNHSSTENILEVVEVRDIHTPFPTLELLIGFLYGHKPDLSIIDISSLNKLYNASDKYQVVDLRKLVAQSLVERMPFRMAAQVAELFDHHGDLEGLELVIDYCCMYYEDIAKVDGLKDMKSKYTAMVTERLDTVRNEMKPYKRKWRP